MKWTNRYKSEKGNESKSLSMESQNKKNHYHNEVVNVSDNTYQCPMKCEGDKTYNQPGNCPVCNMKLAVIN